MNVLKRIVARLHSEVAGKTITSEDWSGKTRTLVHEGTKKPVTVGEVVRGSAQGRIYRPCVREAKRARVSVLPKCIRPRVEVTCQ